MNRNYCAESENVEIPVDQIGQNTKNELFQHKISYTQYVRRASRQWWKEAKVIFSGVFLSTTECSMIITNILKTTYMFIRTVELFQRETCKKRWFPTFTLEQGRLRNKNLKIARCFSGGETSESFNWRA